MKTVSEELVKASSDLLIFSILEKQSMEFEDIRAVLIKVSKGYIKWEYGHLSSILHMMEQKKLVESYWREGDARFGNRQKLYKISSLGKQQLHEKRKSWIFLDQIVNVKKPVVVEK